MRASSVLQGRLIVAAAAIVLTTSACSADADPVQDLAAHGTTQAPAAQADTDTAPEDVLDVLDDALAGPDDDGHDDRVFGATEDMVIQAVESTFESDNAKAEWAGSTLRVSMDGSADSPTASLPCMALEALLADGEDAVIVFSDGELVCADRHTTN